MKIEAATRLQETAGWFESLSDMAKKAYLRMHPNSKQGKNSPPEDKEALRHAHAEARKHAQALHKKLENGGTDAEWRAYDAAQKKLATLTKRLK